MKRARQAAPTVADPFAVPPLVAPEAATTASGFSPPAPSGGTPGGDGVAMERGARAPAKRIARGSRGAGGAGAAESAHTAGGAEPVEAGGAVVAGEDTAAALVAAGRKLFAQHGYDGASVRAITAAANANLGAITYHFGSKKALYNLVVESCVAPLVGRVEAALSGRGPVLDRLEGVVRAYFDHFAENPDLPQLMLQEIVLGGGPPEAAGPFMRRIYNTILATIREGQASGEVRAGDPVLTGMSLISQPIFPMLARHAIEAITGRNMEDARTRELVVEHVAAFARAGLAGPNAGAASALGGATGVIESTRAAAAPGTSAGAAVSPEEAI